MIRPDELLKIKELAYPHYNFDDILPQLIENIGSYQGQLVGIPYDIPIFILMYRADLLDKAGVSVPKTLPEYAAALAKLNQSLSPDIFGTSLQWKPGHYALECNMTSWLWGHGGSIFNRDKSPAINDAKAHEAMRYMLELAKYAPPQTTTFDWSDEAAHFRQGQSAMYISWGEFFPGFDDPKISNIVGKAEAALCPTALALRPKNDCAFGETPGVAHQGGSCLAISKYSKNIEAAWLFLQWATSADITTRSNLLAGGASPIRASNYSDPRTQAQQKVALGTTRHLPIVKKAIETQMGTEPHLATWADLANQHFAVELGKMVTGQQSIGDTLDKMAEATIVAVNQYEQN
ncbi:MAG: extracellular solute-binding protein [Hahellaceae bacterium]|nr:extracellular solute-binding protein [Hahellaceae bacterium]